MFESFISNLKKRRIIIYIFIIIIQILCTGYWAEQKENYYIDELYSIGYASSFTGNGNTARYITTSDEWQFEQWIDVSELKKYIVLSDEESLFSIPFFEAVSKLIFQRNYYGLLNISESIIGDGNVSILPGLILNILFLIVAEFYLDKLLKRIGVSSINRIYSVAMFGLSAYILSMAIYIRFYLLVVMLTMALFNMFCSLWNDSKWVDVIRDTAVIMCLLYFTYKNSELTLIFFGGFLACYIIGLILRKKCKQIVSCAIVIIIGLIYIVLTTDLFGMLFYPDNFSTYEGVAVTASNNIHNSGFLQIIDYFNWTKDLMGKYYFGSIIVVYLLLCGAIIIVLSEIHHMIKDRSKNNFKDFDNNFFIIVLIGATIIYTIFLALCGYDTWRYYCFGFVSLSIIIWFIIDRIIKIQSVSKIKRIVVVILGVVVVVSTILPFYQRNIEYIYEDEKEFVSEIRGYNQNIVLVSSIYENNNVTISRHEVYDCVNLASGASKVFVINTNDYDGKEIEYPDEFMLWSYKTNDITGIIQEFEERGYGIDYIGEDHCSIAYECQK